MIEEVPVDDDASSQHEIRLPPDEPQLLQFPDTLKDPDTVCVHPRPVLAVLAVLAVWPCCVAGIAGCIHGRAGCATCHR